MSELRWHPLLQEWVITATHRQNRTFKPPADYCPLCPSRPGKAATEFPVSEFEVGIFENRFPSLASPPPLEAVMGTPLSPVKKSQGVCEVVVYSAEHEGNLGTLSQSRRELLIRAWQDRTAALYEKKSIKYLLIFENRGDAIGVTLSHPHGQIYAFPYLPPVPAKELAAAKKHFAKTQRNLFLDIAAEELKDGRRIIARGKHWLMVVPFFARYPYEVLLMPTSHFPLLTDLKSGAVSELAAMLGRLVRAYDLLFMEPMPYLMLLQQGPPNAAAYSQVRFSFLPALRTKGKLKFLAGCEQGAGSFINDTLPEETAETLRACYDRA